MKMFGIECFVSIHKAFSGKIKEHWKDFEVKEIGLDGKIVELKDSCQNDSRDIKISHENLGAITSEKLSIDQKERDTTCVVNQKRKCVEIESRNEECDNFSLITDNEQKYQPATTEGVTPKGENINHEMKKDPKEFLTEFLSELTFQKIALMRSSKSVCDPINLGIFDDKLVRAKLHQCVRFVFPNLKTTTVKNDTGLSEIHVQQDPTYNSFLSTGLLNDDTDNLFRFIHCSSINGHETKYVLKSVNEKNQRTEIHRIINTHYGSFLESKTFTSRGDQHESEINVRFRRKRVFSEIQFAGMTRECNIFGFVLCKRNIENSDAISKLSRALNVKPSCFSYAGVKDKKALTYQNMTVDGAELKDLQKFQGQSRNREISISNVKHVAKKLGLGELLGNTFKIILREVDVESSTEVTSIQSLIDTAIFNVKSNGFVNYFGHQRFGFEDNQVNSADVGLAMLKGDFMNAVNLILTPTGQDSIVDNAKRYFQDTKDIAGTMTAMPSWKTREVSVIRSLKQHGYNENGCRNALFGLPYNVRLMYVHSHCSLVWNKMATARVKEYGVHIAEGDIVACDGNSDTQNKGVFHVVSKEDILKRSFDVNQIVLPLPGFKIDFPSNLEQEYCRILKEDGIDRSNFKLSRLRIKVPGVYRKLLAFPKDLQWKYTDDFVNTTRELCSDKEFAESCTKKGNETESITEMKFTSETCCQEAKMKLEIDSAPRKDIDIEVRFSLMPSSYATICLREMMNKNL